MQNPPGWLNGSLVERNKRSIVRMATMAIMTVTASGCGGGGSAPPDAKATAPGPALSTSTTAPSLGPAAPQTTAIGATTLASTIAPVDPAAERAVKQGVEEDRKSTRLNSSHIQKSRMPSSA